MRNLICFFVFLITAISFAQREFHVFPLDGLNGVGSPRGDGSINNPWDLQTALSQSSERVNGGDIIWIHEGIYKGRFKSVLQSTIAGKYVTVSGFKNDKVILDGNIKGDVNYVLEVNGNNVIYKNFELTYLGQFSRSTLDFNFKASVGISHIKGEDCKFQNLVIYNIPGSGIGSWKATGGTIIEDCIIYNNGYIGARGHGVGIYVQNQSENIRRIKNNVIFNNFYKGIEVWSASTGSNLEFVKNVTLNDNVIFNNGSPYGKYVDNIIIASNDADGINVAKRIKFTDNILYHNVDFNDDKNFGYGSSLTLGYSGKSPVEDILIRNNIIIGKNNAFSISQAKSMVFENNTVYAGYIHLNPSVLNGLESNLIKLNNNKYYTRKTAGFRVNKTRDYKLNDWQVAFKVDKSSQHQQLKGFEIEPILKVQALHTNPYHFNITLLEKNGNDVKVDFSDFEIEEGMEFKIYDIENRTEIIKSGKITNDFNIEFPMKLNQLEMPLHNTIATKTANNFGVYRIEFVKRGQRKSFFKRLFSWLF